MNAAPKMAPVGHVTGLALHTFCRVIARQPFVIGVLNQFTVKGIIIFAKLMADFEKADLPKALSALKPLWGRGPLLLGRRV